MDIGGAYGGGKAGGAFDPIAFVQRPIVILRAVCWLFAIIVFGCISSEGWREESNGKEYCIINRDGNACNYAVGIGVIAFLASMGFIAGEYLFEQMSSVKTRKHYVLADLGFSAFWSFLFFIGFCYLTNQWGKADDPPNGEGVNNVQASIVFSFFSIFTWAGCAYFAFLRFKAGVDPSFSSTYESDPSAAQQYSAYPASNDNDQFQEAPFSGQQQQQQQQQQRADYSQPTY
ncbi:synaptogyrin isoform X1 [Anopheles aquasalis]|uniref:synaptogyrin isoform X1 n=1 Tax=Anopheles darlingi TaxID=43151 RepID=UPI00210022CA|nr:synaptogyrin isoform X1 [Anopheles darlingi]XP_050090071.1 synaptogyrin isoform X1 [Anopheles aquasalis]